jgi:hypothetical protein
MGIFVIVVLQIVIFEMVIFDLLILKIIIFVSFICEMVFCPFIHILKNIQILQKELVKKLQKNMYYLYS